MTTVINVHQAKTQLSRLLRRVQAGEWIIIARSGQPVARLVPVTGPRSPRVPGTLEGEIVLGPDFEADQPDELLDALEGPGG